MNLRAERRERIAEFISSKRRTTAIEIFYALEGTDYEASIPTIRRDVEYLMYEKDYGINTQHGGHSCIYAESNWFYSQPISSKDIVYLESLQKYLPKNEIDKYLEVVKRVKRIKEEY